jgi:drug/metabolite transporter (DMT)-like permease
MFLVFALLGYGLLSIVAILDKFIVSASSQKKALSPAIFVFYSTVFVLPVFLLVPFGVHFLSTPFDWAVALVSGLGYVGGLWTMYRGLAASEVSHLGPLVGASTPFFVFILAFVFFNERLALHQILAIFFLIAGSLIISFEQSLHHRGWHRGMLWGVLAGLFFAVSHLSAKYMYQRYGFYSGLIWTRGAIGFGAVGLIIFSKEVRNLFFSRKEEKKSTIKNFFSAGFFLAMGDQLLGAIGGVLLQYSTSLGSVSLVNALNGFQYALLIILVTILSKFKSSRFREEYARFELIQEMVGVAVIAIGLSLLFF